MVGSVKPKRSDVEKLLPKTMTMRAAVQKVLDVVEIGNVGLACTVVAVELVEVGSRSKVVSGDVVTLLPVVNVTGRLSCIVSYCTVN